MSHHPILIIGGTGIVGRQTARFLREAHPELPLLIGGRDLKKAQAFAAEIGAAESVAPDLKARDLGLGDRPLSAVLTLFTDERGAALRFAQARGVPYLDISPNVTEIGPHVAAYAHRPQASALVLGTEWLVGATSVPALHFAKAFKRLDEVTLGALVDEEDDYGPASHEDLERQTKTAPATLARRDGVWHWPTGDAMQTSFRAVDGTEMPAVAMSPHDVIGVATATEAPNVRFALAMGVSSSRRRGEPVSTEILIELAGIDRDGRPLRTRHAIVHPQGQMPVTGLGVAMVLERLTGLDGQPPTPPGLYFPHQLLEPKAYFARLQQVGGVVLDLSGR